MSCKNCDCKNKWVEDVKHFHKAFNHEIDCEPTNELLVKRKYIVAEEFTEFLDAIEELLMYKTKENEIELLDAIVDGIYTLIGTGVALGYDLEKAFNIIQASNMSKLDENGKPLINPHTGKVMKSDCYVAPKLENCIKDRKVVDTIE